MSINRVESRCLCCGRPSELRLCLLCVSEMKRFEKLEELRARHVWKVFVFMGLVVFAAVSTAMLWFK